jgi:predicted TIM-barrel fold metal-dependent hydrolase
MERYNIIKAVTSGPLDNVRRWRAAAPDRIIGSPIFPYFAPSPELGVLRAEYLAGRLGALGELTAQYAGLSASDPALEPYLALAEELDIPVGIHTGIGPPGATYTCCPKFREKLGNPLLLEEALARHPKLRVYIMHAGYPFLEETVALMHAYPQVYADVANINWLLPREEFYSYLRRLMQAGLGKRLMFGSDQMVWPEAIGMAVESIESADFLTAEQKRDVFYNNAARFLRLVQGTNPRSM